MKANIVKILFPLHFLSTRFFCYLFILNLNLYLTDLFMCSFLPLIRILFLCHLQIRLWLNVKIKVCVWLVWFEK